jgi:hypothetical protein
MGHYFSIANNDVRSKQTLALLMHLFRMQSGEAKTGPILTLPVTR